MKFLDTEGLKYYTDKLIAYINEKVSNVDISTKQDQLIAGDNITIDSNNKISAIDTKYTHPSSHSATMITETTDKKFMTSAEKTKLDGIATNANYYTHPSTHPASMIVETTGKRFVSDTEKSSWNNKQDKLTAGANIKIDSNNNISATVPEVNYPVKSVNSKTGVVTITKSDLGLGSVENIGIKILTESQYNALSSTEKNRSDVLYGTY